MPNFYTFDNEKLSPTDEELQEIARYLGYKKSNPPDLTVSTLISECAVQMLAVLKPRAVWEVFEMSISGENGNKGDRPRWNNGDSPHCARCIKFADVEINSVDLGRNLDGCKKVAVLAGTIGPLVDNLIRKMQKTDPVKASILQATGAMYIEKVIDEINLQIKKDASESGMNCKPRYSPGYGDVPLTMQKDFFRLLPCTKIGLTLMDTLIMSPEKSVTAFIGIY